ncbi:hypothetical protein JYU34_013186 [Plutella xylostella]|uniref:Uncharacterized protein n=1 Tax=Plutella xylostella TaxID=51655 RepID=A0ABQ7QD51_PLUXY|nr:hypothetical protein JYU34_013186 [Plutella xylostella]
MTVRRRLAIKFTGGFRLEALIPLMNAALRRAPTAAAARGARPALSLPPGGCGGSGGGGGGGGGGCRSVCVLIARLCGDCGEQSHVF